MREALKKTLAILFILSLTVMPAFSKDNKKMISHIDHNFSVAVMPDEISFRTVKKIALTDDIVIPQRSIVTADLIQAQKELRWHKSGYILCKLKSYTTEYDNVEYDIPEDVYFIAKKYEPINKKEASILATEIVLAQGASFFAPGVDILYFFTKGAIQREKHPNWFKAGVSNAYDNSICWFWLKGKPIDLKRDERIELSAIDEEKVMKLKGKIEKRKAKQSVKDQKKLVKKIIKQNKKQNKVIAKGPSDSFFVIADQYDAVDPQELINDAVEFNVIIEGPPLGLELF